MPCIRWRFDARYFTLCRACQVFGDEIYDAKYLKHGSKKHICSVGVFIKFIQLDPPSHPIYIGRTVSSGKGKRSV